MVSQGVADKPDKGGQTSLCPPHNPDGHVHHPIGVSVCPDVRNIFVLESKKMIEIDCQKKATGNQPDSFCSCIP